MKNQNSFREKKKKKETFSSSSSSSSSSGLLHFHDGILYSLSLFYAARGIYIGMRFFSYSSVCVCCSLLIDRGDMNIQVSTSFSFPCWGAPRTFKRNLQSKRRNRRKSRSFDDDGATRHFPYEITKQQQERHIDKGKSFKTLRGEFNSAENRI